MFGKITKRYLIDLDAAMREQFTSKFNDEPGFGVMMRYALGWVNADGSPHDKPTGKRLRPVLLLLVTESAGGEKQHAMPAAAAVELLHNFSLIHDDIQDDSPTRHNRPTVWQHWGRANAINAGDAMFALAYTAVEQVSEYLTPARAQKIWRIFNATNLELTRGQHLDMRFETQDTVPIDAYISMIEGKSAALLAACCQMGALVAQDDDELAAQYAQFGLNIGIAFQIRDDILGIWGDPAITGKSAATDIVSRKKSLPVLYGLAQSEELAHIYHKEDFGEADVAQAVRLLDDVGARAYARQLETNYHEKAMQALQAANPQGEAAEGLHEFVAMLFQRNY